MSFSCVCKTIKQVDINAAFATGVSFTRGKDLYAAAWQERMKRQEGFKTGREEENGSRPICSTCMTDFTAAVAARRQVEVEADPSTTSLLGKVIMLTALPSVSAEKAPVIGKCGRDCNTCAPELSLASGCTP